MAPRNEIPTATPMFSGSGNSMALSGSLHLETGSKKFKMAAAKSEVLVSQGVQVLCTSPGRTLQQQSGRSRQRPVIHAAARKSSHTRQLLLSIDKFYVVVQFVNDVYNACNLA